MPYSITTSYENRLEIVKLPDRTEFSIGEMYDLNGGLVRYKVIKYCYDNGGYIVVEDSGNIEMNSEAIDLETNYDPNTKGKYTINLQYKDSYYGYDEYSSPKASFCVNVVSSTVTTTQTTTSAYTMSSTSAATTTQPVVYNLGDPNKDGNVDATDASFVLSVYAIISTGGKSGLTQEQVKAADVNSDKKVDAADASDILSYYSYVSTGGKDDILTFLK